MALTSGDPIEIHLPCESCGSSDALARYPDHTFCFKCGQWVGVGSSGEPLVEDELTVEYGELIPPAMLSYSRLNARHISSKACRMMGYGVFNGRQLAPYFDTDGTLLFQKARGANKEFSVLRGASTGDLKLNQLLFGRATWGDGGGSKLIITEGEIDCLTAVDALGTAGFHSVSVSSGAQGALKCVQANFEFINSYAEIYLCFDNDEPGRKATDQVAQTLSLPNLKLLNLGQHKDLNDLWLAEGNTGVTNAYLNARKYKPDGIIAGDDLWDEVNKIEPMGLEFPWPSFNDYTYGIRPNEMWVITAGSGIGKTTFFKSIEAHCITQGLKLGIIHIEEQVRDSVISLMALTSGTPKDDLELTRENFDKFLETSDLVFYDKLKGFEEEQLLSTMQYMVQGLGCDVIFLDHVTAVVDQYDNGDLNQKTRNLISTLGKTVARLPFTLFMISHLRKAKGQPHEEGGRVFLDDLLGASALKQWANYVVGLERDNQTDDALAKNRPVARFLKNRHRGEFAGKLVNLEYSPVTGTIQEVDPYDGTNTTNTPKKTKGLQGPPTGTKNLPDF